ncbi:ACP S-malonyltransferase [Teredinibacter sp. KSP-S5-2]|uniref:ACP S-malonyltransferase n=1 Tax=Teredinibacter sp. KSP-S5-2 TaxID=3034506 RepID=UPI002934BB36|nr:ACP S-malonyltransferase [Teredinibacter sp. KSP-S5-2]WNO11548.1 ACP S-malonyltransferase [Teredinibacter sp. KSP-S5-2]
MKTYVFPGQGSQAKGMGEGLFDQYPDLVKKADKILGYSIKELCLQDTNGELGKTQYTQPALYVVNALSYFKQIDESGEKPDFVAGHSLGEFNALLAAECFDFETGLKLVKKRGELMSQAPEGAMAAILNMPKDDILKVLKDNNLNNIDVANYNTFSQIVISGAFKEIGEAEFVFQDAGARYYPLNTSGAFHSRFMKPSGEKFESYLKRFKFSEPKIPVVANVTAAPYAGGEIITNLSNQISGSVRWSESVLNLLKIAAEQGEEMEFVEIGHGDVLTKIIAKIRVETAEELECVKMAQNTEAQASAPEQKVSVIFDIAENATAEDIVIQWNKQFSVGTRVTSTTEGYGDLETRTEAVVLFGHRAAVYMKGYNGYFDLREVTPA